MRIPTNITESRFLERTKGNYVINNHTKMENASKSTMTKINSINNITYAAIDNNSHARFPNVPPVPRATWPDKMADLLAGNAPLTVMTSFYATCLLIGN